MSFETVALAGAGILFAGSVVLYVIALQLVAKAELYRASAESMIAEAYRVTGLTGRDV
jgi:hypothetical protein